MQCKTVMLLKAAFILWYLVVLSLVEIVVRVKYIHRWTIDKNCINLPAVVMSNNMRLLFHIVLIIIMTTTTTTSPAPRPTLSLRSEAFLRNRDASDRKRSLEVFSRSDLATINLEIGWRLNTLFNVSAWTKPVLKFRKIVSPVEDSPNIASHNTSNLQQNYHCQECRPIPPHLLHLATQTCQPVPNSRTCSEKSFVTVLSPKHAKWLPCRKKSSSSLAAVPPPSSRSPSSSLSNMGSSLSSTSAGSPPTFPTSIL